MISDVLKNPRRNSGFFFKLNLLTYVFDYRYNCLKVNAEYKPPFKFGRIKNKKSQKSGILTKIKKRTQTVVCYQHGGMDVS